MSRIGVIKKVPPGNLSADVTHERTRFVLIGSLVIGLGEASDLASRGRQRPSRPPVPKDGYNGAISSGNAVMILNLPRLGRITGKSEYKNRQSTPAAHSQPTCCARPQDSQRC